MLQQNKNLPKIVAEGVKKDSTLISICQDNFPEYFHSAARLIWKRIQTKKFNMYWDSLPKLGVKSNKDKSNVAIESPPMDNKIFLFCFKIKRNLLLDENFLFLSKSREWTQNVYESLPGNLIKCVLVIKNKYISSSKKCLTIRCECRFKKCCLKYILECDEIYSDTINFKVQ